jgi:predicted transport protein
MLRFAGYYAAFSVGRNAASSSVPHLARLRQLAEVAAILVMRLSDCLHRVGSLAPAEFNEAIQLLESYVFRRAVCGRQTRGYWSAFAAIAYRIDEQDPLTSLKVALYRQTESYRFPSNEEFERELQTRDLYRMRTCHYLLDRLENYNSKEPTDTRLFTVEHVLPQNETLSRSWRDMLGEHWRETQAVWLHRLGNLTLTGYNSTYSDRSFQEKKQIEGGFNDSAIRLNRLIRDANQWTAAEIEERGRLLAQKAVEIWPALVVSEDAVRAAEQQDLVERANRRDASEVPMTQRARQLFNALRPMVQHLGDNIVELAEPKSISYHADDFFVEVLPRKRRLLLILNLEFAECHDLDEQATDASERAFYIHAKHEGGVVYRIQDESHLEGAMRMVRQAYEATLA